MASIADFPPIMTCRGEQSDAAPMADLLHSRRAKRRRPRREAGGKSSKETSDSKSFHAAPKARPPSGQDGRRGNSHPRRARATANRRALSPRTISKAARAFRKPPQTTASQNAPHGRGPALCESGKEEHNAAISHILQRFIAAGTAMPPAVKQAAKTSRKGSIQNPSTPHQPQRTKTHSNECWPSLTEREGKS